jgi:hypothetical protein
VLAKPRHRDLLLTVLEQAGRSPGRQCSLPSLARRSSSWRFRCPDGTRLLLGLRGPASRTGGLFSAVPVRLLATLARSGQALRDVLRRYARTIYSNPLSGFSTERRSRKDRLTIARRLQRRVACAGMAPRAVGTLEPSPQTSIPTHTADRNPHCVSSKM